MFVKLLQGKFWQLFLSEHGEGPAHITDLQVRLHITAGDDFCPRGVNERVIASPSLSHPCH